MFTFDHKGLEDGLLRLAAAHDRAITAGLRSSAARAEAILQSTHAHGDITGATRASYRVYADVDAASAAASGYAAAQAALASHAQRGFTVVGHAVRQTFERLTAGERGVGYASFTSYQDSLERDNGGQKAAIGPTLQQTGSSITQEVAHALKGAR